MKSSATTAKSQAMAVCCAAIVGRPTATTAVVGPCPAMIQWARSPALFRQWAEDWVLPPLWDAVFRLPLEGSTGELWNQHKMVCVSVSMTVGLVRISVFTSHSELGLRLCGCIGDDRVMVSSTNGSWSRGGHREYFIRDATKELWDARRHTAEASLSDWASVGFPQCNRRWIVGYRDGGGAEPSFHIHKVSCGVPVGSDVVVKCGGQLRIVDEVALLGDTAMIAGCNSSRAQVVALVDLQATFSNKKELVLAAKIEGDGVAWMPDGSICSLVRGGVETTGSESHQCYLLVDEFPVRKTRWVFPQDEVVKQIGRNHLFSRPSDWSQATRFQVFHTGDLAHPSLCVPCTWACPDRQTGITISTSHHNNHGGKSGATMPEIELSLHDGVSGMHIDTAHNDMKSSGTTAKSQAMAVCCAAIVGRPTTAAKTTGPCPSMIQWARSPVLVRQWAEDWVLPPLWDAVFRLPLEGSTGGSWEQHKMVCVSVSMTMGLVGLTEFTSHSESGARVCGCIGDDRVLVSNANVWWPTAHDREYFIRDTKQPVWYAQHSSPEASLRAWESVSFPQCNRRWIVGFRYSDGCGAESALHIHKVSCGVPVGPDVVVKCSGQLPIVNELTLIGDTAMIRGWNSSPCRVVSFVDLQATFCNRKELVLTMEIEGDDLAWMLDGGTAVQKTGRCVFPPDETVIPVSRNHLFSRSSALSQVSMFRVYHTGDLVNPSLCVPCTWAYPDRQTGIIISTSHHNNHGGESVATMSEIEFSLHDGVSGMHIGVFRVTYSSLFTFKPYP
ncbi:hypothetical protein Pelo_17324 [Pelomyxa schiedti]|nr:hypothetical protein Pelo_17324 [Pelomyxa schiedti]